MTIRTMRGKDLNAKKDLKLKAGQGEEEVEKDDWEERCTAKFEHVDPQTIATLSGCHKSQRKDAEVFIKHLNELNRPGSNVKGGISSILELIKTKYCKDPTLLTGIMKSLQSVNIKGFKGVGYFKRNARIATMYRSIIKSPQLRAEIECHGEGFADRFLTNDLHIGRQTLEMVKMYAGNVFMRAKREGDRDLGAYCLHVQRMAETAQVGFENGVDEELWARAKSVLANYGSVDMRDTDWLLGGCESQVKYKLEHVPGGW